MPFVESGDVIVLKALFAKLSARTGRFGNPIGRVSDGSFPYFCPYRNRVPARHERKRILLFQRGKTDCHGAKAPRNDRGVRIAARLTAVSPAGSVGASASQRCPPDTRTLAMTKGRIAAAVYTASQ